MISLSLDVLTRGYRNKELILKLTKRIRQEVEDESYKFMHVCGTHENTITKNGLRPVLPTSIDIVAGPGCPVCVTHPEKIELAMKLLEENKDIILTTFGDMFRVPSQYGRSLSHVKAKGADIRVVYSITDSINMAKDNKNKEVVHFAIGFETTASSTAVSLLQDPPKNFSIISTHFTVPPCLDHLLSSGEIAIQGLIQPGHVSAIIGAKAYEFLVDKYNVAQVIAGFEPVDILIALINLIDQIKEGKSRVDNEYGRVVKSEGNLKAIYMINEVFRLEDAKWRGLGNIPNSGLQLKPEFTQFDVSTKFDIEPPEIVREMEAGCRCSDVIKGLIKPQECQLFERICTPYDPRGPCMVGSEGTCAIAYKYGRFKIENPND